MDESSSYVLAHDTSNVPVIDNAKEGKKRKRKVSTSVQRLKKRAKSNVRCRKIVTASEGLSNKSLKRLKRLQEKSRKRGTMKNLLEDLHTLEASEAELKQYVSFKDVGKTIRNDKLQLKKKKTKPRADASYDDDVELDETSLEASTAFAPVRSTLPAATVSGGDATTALPERNCLPAEIQRSAPAVKQTFNLPKRPAPISHSAPAVFVPVDRTSEIQELRRKLPIFTEEASIIEAVRENDIVIVCGETGSGKTTQVPQFLYEAGFSSDGRLIGITEPRRIAAESMSRRVAIEMNLPESVISYQIRFAGTSSSETRVKFMTDGVLLREIKDDFLLRRYACVLVDEAHERSMHSDILIGLLSRIVVLRRRAGGELPPLKLVVMSATLRVEDFCQPRLFVERPRILHIAARQFPVRTFFSRRTNANYVEEAVRKVCKIHERLPPGGILVFVSGQHEVWRMVKLLTEAFAGPTTGGEIEEDGSKRKKRRRKRAVADEPRTSLLDSYDPYRGLASTDLNEPGILEEQFDGEDDDDEDDDVAHLMATVGGNAGPLHCLPLYSMMPAERQRRIFEPPPTGARLCVIATNVAETSLTIPDVRYVVDTGKEKRRLYDVVTGASKFVVDWISRASAAQRTGRAGRTAPGFCYRLYSRAVFLNDFQEFTEPEILTKPIDELVLQMKAMGVAHVESFPFPSAPDGESVRQAELRLVRLGALEFAEKGDATTRHYGCVKAAVGLTWPATPTTTRITTLGESLALFPVAPPYGKILALGGHHDLLRYCVALVAALSVREPLVNIASFKSADAAQTNEAVSRAAQLLRVRRGWAASGEALLLGDLCVLICAVGAAEFANYDAEFCEVHTHYR